MLGGRLFPFVVALYLDVTEACVLQHRQKLVLEVQSVYQGVLLLGDLLAVSLELNAHLERNPLFERIEIKSPDTHEIHRPI